MVAVAGPATVRRASAATHSIRPCGPNRRIACGGGMTFTVARAGSARMRRVSETNALARDGRRWASAGYPLLYLVAGVAAGGAAAGAL